MYQVRFVVTEESEAISLKVYRNWLVIGRVHLRLVTVPEES